MKVQIRLESLLSDDSDAVTSYGEMKVSPTTLFLTWKQPPEKDEAGGSMHRLTYRKLAGMLHMKRSGDYATDLWFSESSCTKGALITPHGDFAMEIETVMLSVPDGLWTLADEKYDDLTGKGRKEYILLSYFLTLSGQEPMKNDISICIRLAKNDDLG